MKATFNKIVDNLVKVLDSKTESAQYFSDSEQYVMMCGWCGTMSPISRPAFYKEFGKDTTEAAEAKAREIIAEKEAARKRTKYHEHAQEADRLEGVPPCSRLTSSARCTVAARRNTPHKYPFYSVCEILRIPPRLEAHGTYQRSRRHRKLLNLL